MTKWRKWYIRFLCYIAGVDDPYQHKLDWKWDGLTHRAYIPDTKMCVGKVESLRFGKRWESFCFVARPCDRGAMLANHGSTSSVETAKAAMELHYSLLTGQGGLTK